jgi:hypothetical protein
VTNVGMLGCGGAGEGGVQVVKDLLFAHGASPFGPFASSLQLSHILVDHAVALVLAFCGVFGGACTHPRKPHRVDARALPCSAVLPTCPRLPRVCMCC